MINHFHFPTLFASTTLFLTLAACSSSDAQAEPTPQEKFTSALSSAYKKCEASGGGAASSCGSSLDADAAKVAGLLSPTLLQGATKCMESTACGAEPISCLGSSLGELKATDAQTKLATDYCELCSTVGGEACTTAFFGTADVPGLAFLLLPFGDEVLADVDESVQLRRASSERPPARPRSARV